MTAFAEPTATMRYPFAPPAIEYLQPGAPNALASKLAEAVGITLLPWQDHVLSHMTAKKPNGKWAARESILLVSRQNGKSMILMLRILAGALLFGDKEILWSAHEHKTAVTLFREMVELIDNTPMLRAQVAKVWSSTAEQRILFVNGANVKLLARTPNSGRGLRPDLIVLDEAFSVPSEMVSALMPAQVSRANPQAIWCSSAGDDRALELIKLRERMLTGTDPLLTGWEWAADPDLPIDDPATWRAANPSCPEIIPEEALQAQLLKMSATSFRREHLGQWPVVLHERVFESDEISDALVPAHPAPDDRSTLAFGVEIAQEGVVRSLASVVACWVGEDGIPMLSVIKTQSGVEWLIDFLGYLNTAYPGCPIAFDSKSPGRDIFERAERLHEMELTPLSWGEYTLSCSAFLQAMKARRLKICSEPNGLVLDLGPARQKTTGAVWVWERATPAPPAALIAATAALYATELVDHGMPMVM